MYIFECKECGGRNEVKEGSAFFTCAYCSKQITLPTIQDEERVRLFNRANYFRRQGEFDKAISAFTGIVNQNEKDPEATWGLVLAKYGIEYVEDPRTHERIPTCNRASNNSILTDSDYLATLDNAKNEYIRSLYVKEAERIDKIQLGILDIAKREEPFDVFICYKESTGGGSRTEDSVLAQDIYDRLTKEGLRVFFSRITLEDKLGKQYEPYIFAALNSAKVMLVVATSAENVNSVWVKNEWERFLILMKQDHGKVLIPCYKKMDIYDLPEALNVYQSQDMGKIGAMQDLVRGVKKVSDKAHKQDSFHKSTQENTSAMLERGFIYLRNADFNKANIMFEQVLNLNPHEANAYLGKLMIERKVCVDDNLATENILLQRSSNFNLAMEFGEAGLKRRLEAYQKAVEENAKRRINKTVEQAKTRKETAHENEIERIQESIDEKKREIKETADELNEAKVALKRISKYSFNWGILRLIIGIAIIFFRIKNASTVSLNNGPAQMRLLVSLFTWWPLALGLIGSYIFTIEDRRQAKIDKKQTIQLKKEEIERINSIQDANEQTISRLEEELDKTNADWANECANLKDLQYQLNSGRYDNLIEMEGKIAEAVS